MWGPPRLHLGGPRRDGTPHTLARLEGRERTYREELRNLAGDGRVEVSPRNDGWMYPLK